MSNQLDGTSGFIVNLEDSWSQISLRGAAGGTTIRPPQGQITMILISWEKFEPKPESGQQILFERKSVRSRVQSRLEPLKFVEHGLMVFFAMKKRRLCGLILIFWFNFEKRKSPLRKL